MGLGRLGRAEFRWGPRSAYAKPALPPTALLGDGRPRGRPSPPRGTAGKSLAILPVDSRGPFCPAAAQARSAWPQLLQEKKRSGIVSGTIRNAAPPVAGTTKMRPALKTRTWRRTGRVGRSAPSNRMGQEYAVGLNIPGTPDTAGCAGAASWRSWWRRSSPMTSWFGGLDAQLHSGGGFFADRPVVADLTVTLQEGGAEAVLDRAGRALEALQPAADRGRGRRSQAPGRHPLGTAGQAVARPRVGGAGEATIPLGTAVRAPAPEPCTARC